MADITSANAVLLLTIPLIFPAPTQIQGFGMEDIFTAAKVKPVETRMGLDGGLSGGFIPTEKKFEITLMAGSPSNSYFDALVAQMYRACQAFSIFGSLSLPSLGLQFNLINGFLTDYPPMPDSKKVLQERKYELTFENIFGVPIGLAG